MDPSFWQMVFDQLERELAATQDAGIANALCCRLAVLHWDILGDREAARRWLLRADPEYRPAQEHRRQMMLDEGDTRGAAGLLEEIAIGRADNATQARTLLAEAALIWLLWVGDLQRLKKTCSRLGEAGMDDPRLADLKELALVATDDVEGLEQWALSPSAPLSVLLRLAVLLLDRFDRPQVAAGLLERAVALDDEDPYVLELLIEASARLANTSSRITWMERKYELLSRVAPRDHDVLALAFGLARALIELGEGERAALLLRQVDPPLEEMDTKQTMEMLPTRWAAALVSVTKRDLAALRGDHNQLSRDYLELAQASSLEPLCRAYRLRAAQLLGLEDDSHLARVETLLKDNLQTNPSDAHSAKALERLLFRQHRMPELCALYEAWDPYAGDQRGHLLRRAGLIAEAHLNDRVRAARLIHDSLTITRDGTIVGELQRLSRAQGEDHRLVEAYQREADSTPDTRRRGLLSSAVAALNFKMQHLAEAEVAAQQALLASAVDPLALALLVTIYRSEKRDAEVQRLLQMQVDHLCAPHNRAACLVELSRMADGPQEAKELLIQAHDVDPQNTNTLDRLIHVCEEAGDLQEAVQWGLKLARGVTSEDRATEVSVTIGRLYQRLGEHALAEEFLSKALKLDPLHVEALQSMATIYRSSSQMEPLLSILKRIVPLTPPESGRGDLLLEIGSTLVKLNAGIEDVFEAFASAAQLGAINAEAISDLEWVCRQQHRLELLADFLARLPQDVDTLYKLAEALEELGDLDALLRVRYQLVDLADSDVERADRTHEVGRVLEALRRPREALERYEQVISLVPSHRQALRALGRLYRAEERFVDLVAILQRELSLQDSADRQVELLMELARTHEKLGETDSAAEKLEQALGSASDPLDILRYLQRLYDPDKPADLARVLELLAQAEPDVQEKVALLMRAGELARSLGSGDHAARMFQEAFRHDPGNRQTFTIFEAFCYQNERWHDLMELYNGAIHYVEMQGGRDYRPLDLYTRRGQLQLSQLAQPGEASMSFLKALEHDPKSESVMKLLENIFVAQQDWLGLIKTHEKRAELVPDNELFRMEALRQAARLATGRLPPRAPEARALWERCHAIDPTDDETLDNLERIYCDNQLDESLARLLETRLALATSDDETVALHSRLAKLLESELEDPISAAQQYEAIRQIHQHHEEALKSLARIYEATGEWDRCLEVLRDLVIMEADPHERSLLYFRCGSIVESRFHEDEEAIDYYEAAIKEASACLPAIHGLRDLHLRRKQWDKALQTLELEVQLWDDNREEAGVLARMGELYLQHLNDPAKAIELFSDALTIDPECLPATIALFEISYTQGDTTKALKLSEKLVSRMAKEGNPQQRSRFFCRRGQLLASRNDSSGAAESLVLALQLVPENLEALDWLVTVCRRDAEAYDFAAIFRDLEQVYRRGDSRGAVSHVLVAAGALSEMAGDAETAMARYQEAMEEAPEELLPVVSLSNLLIGLSQVKGAIVVLQRLRLRTEEITVQVQCLMHLADIWSNVVMDHEEAVRMYEAVLQLDPDNQGATFHLAQEYYLQQRYDEAGRLLRSLIDGALMEGRPGLLSGYAHHLGSVLLRMDDSTGAMQQFTIALEHDDLNAGAAIGMARLLEQQGNRNKAIQLLKSTIRKSKQRPERKQESLDLRRALAMLLLGNADLDAAAAQYRVVIEESGSVEDRITLAEILSQEGGDFSRATTVLWRALECDGFNPHVLQRLGEVYERQGMPYRTLQVYEVMDVLGWTSREQRNKLGQLRRQYSFKPARSLDDKLRQLLSAPLQDIHLQRVWECIKQPMDRLFPFELSGESLESAGQTGSADFRHVVDHCIQFFAINIPVYVAKEVPGGAAADDTDGGRIVMDRLFLDRPFPEVAFVLGRHIEYFRSGHALLSRLAFDDRLLLGELLVGLLQEPDAQNDLVQEFCKGLSRRYIRQIEEVAAEYQQALLGGEPSNQPARWFSSIDRRANQAGLVTCDDIATALRMAAQLGGQELAVGAKGEVAVQLVTDGPELVQFFLSESYLKLKRKLADFPKP